jgi:ribose 5-phosphate isomerase A
MFWNNSLITSFAWSGEISNRETKEKIAEKLALLVQDGDIIGV